MRAVIQRVREARCVVEGEVSGAIGRGLLLFLGVGREDSAEDLDWLCGKIPEIRCFEDAAGKMNLSLREIGGDVLLISQFTLFGNLRKGNRPSFNRSAPPEVAVPMYEAFRDRLAEQLGRPVATGVFAADMAITAVNEGPVTLILDSKEKSL